VEMGHRARARQRVLIMMVVERVPREKGTGLQ
jgi:hypothetical protein